MTIRGFASRSEGLLRSVGLHVRALADAGLSESIEKGLSMAFRFIQAAENFRNATASYPGVLPRNPGARKSLQTRPLHNFTTINATRAQGRSKLQAINQTEGPR